MATALHPRREPDGALIDGRYRLGALCGSGTGGQVFAVHDGLDDRVVALKLVAREVGGLDVEFLSTRSLVHPYIVRVFDVGQADAGHDSFTMELLDGRDRVCVAGDLG